MFQLLKQTNIDFMARRVPVLWFSAILVVIAIVVLFVRGGGNPILGLHPGIEFTGGTELQLKFSEKPDLGAIRSALADAEMPSSLVTTIGAVEENEVYVRVGTTGEDDQRADFTAKVVQAVEERMGGARAEGLDLNVVDRDVLGALLSRTPELDAEGAEALAAAVLERRKDQAIFRSVEDLGSVEGMTPAVLAYLNQNAFTGPLAVRSQSYIGPAIGRELLNKALVAIIGSLIGMLIYIWIRFQLQWGLAAVLALAHDTAITLGLFSLFGMEMSLPVVAAFLTLVGYSVNDTVVVFDRIRENVRLQKAKSFEDVVNLSINQTLSRTVITSGLTWVVALALLFFGGSALKPFAFVLSAGVVVGTYSSIYVASPFLVLWRHYVTKRADRASAAAGDKGGPSSKAIRSSSAG